MQIRAIAASLLLLATLSSFPAKAETPLGPPAAAGTQVSVDISCAVASGAGSAARQAAALPAAQRVEWLPRLFHDYAACKDMPVAHHAAPVKKHVAVATPAHLRSIHVMATAYALRGRTAHGTYTDHGTIAVDPRVIPMGTRIFVPGYGWGRAEDTGGAIKGNVIDLWMPSVHECMSWGVRQIEIMVDDGRTSAPTSSLVQVEHPNRRMLASRSGRRHLHKAATNGSR